MKEKFEFLNKVDSIYNRGSTNNLENNIVRNRSYIISPCDLFKKNFSDYNDSKINYFYDFLLCCRIQEHGSEFRKDSFQDLTMSQQRDIIDLFFRLNSMPILLNSLEYHYKKLFDKLIEKESFQVIYYDSYKFDREKQKHLPQFIDITRDLLEFGKQTVEKCIENDITWFYV